MIECLAAVATLESIEKLGNIRGHNNLRISQRVHEEHFVPLVQRHTKIEHRRLHR